ncbi:hypothetical protein CCOS865_00669 [Pseudomonas reidholzensis]|uniref:DUF3077 domain-containing protein n=1 Tax=Pseudomonas reidholzensis TaxID=1785162 RepID=A0A383RPQ2_9PSED|nr:DUF3077 domain-containing protein [Pseudomonas reidholzensis]SYX88441.1 hypothetical protein CCOS865_00669 [Pseudomonas reidholzensis]
MSQDLSSWTTAGLETCLDLYRIQPGIPAERAFEEISVLLGLVSHLTLEAELNGDQLALSAARYLSTFAKAVSDDIENGKMQTDAPG